MTIIQDLVCKKPNDAASVNPETAFSARETNQIAFCEIATSLNARKVIVKKANINLFICT